MEINKLILKKDLNPKKKGRNAGIDLLRILGMLDIVVCHTIIDSNIYNRYSKYFNQIKYMEVFTNWHISTFGIISGIVGFRNYKTLKYSNLLYLWLLVTFYQITVHISYNIYRNIHSSLNIRYFFPAINGNHWYFTCYFGMYFFLPIINRGLFYLTKNEFTIIVISLIGIFVFWRDYNLYLAYKELDPFSMNSGRSMIGLILFYIIGAYIGKYFINDTKKRKIYYYLICILVFVVSGHLINHYLNYIGYQNYKRALKALLGFRLNSIPTLLQSISLALFFSHLKFNNNLAKFISFFGQLAFSVYIIHDQIDIRYVIFTNLFHKYPYEYSLSHVLFLIVLNALRYSLICMIIDIGRFLLFKLFRVRKLCLFLDKIINLFTK